MSSGTLTLIVAALLLASAAPLSAKCPTDTILISGKSENAPPGASIRIELLYRHAKLGESDTLIAAGSSFRSRIPFFTQSRAPKLMGELFEKCERAPESVRVMLMDGSQEIDQVTLTVAKDLKRDDAGELATRDDIVLHGKK